MLNPATLFVACLVALTANPSFVQAIPLPLPPAPHRSPSTTLRHRAFKPTRRLPILRIVDDDRYTEPASWTHILTNDALPESIFVDDDRVGLGLGLDLEIASVHRPHNFRHNLPPPSSKRAGAQSSSPRRVKRSVSESNRTHVKRFSSRWLEGQAAKASRAAEAAAKATTSTSIVWTKVSTTSRSFAQPTSVETVSSASSASSLASTSAPASTAAPTNAATPSLSGTHSGDGTWFAPGLGACGTVATDSSAIVAVSHLLYDSYPGATLNPNLNPICGQRIRATYRGNSVDVTVQDRCEGCDMWDLDFSPKLFGELADLGVGRLHGVEWTFI